LGRYFYYFFNKEKLTYLLFYEDMRIQSTEAFMYVIEKSNIM